MLLPHCLLLLPYFLWKFCVRSLSCGGVVIRIISSKIVTVLSLQNPDIFLCETFVVVYLEGVHVFLHRFLFV